MIELQLFDDYLLVKLFGIDIIKYYTQLIKIDNITPYHKDIYYIPLEKLIDIESKTYKNMNLQYMDYDIKEILLNNPLLLKTPILRNNKKNVSIGYNPEIWKEWLNNS